MVHGTSQNEVQEVCKDFRKGKCRYGDECKFFHDVNSKQTPAIRDSVAVDEQVPPPNRLPAAHASTSSQVTTQAGHSTVKAVGRVNQPCRLWQSGSCRWGVRCRFQHAIEIASPSANSVPSTSAGGGELGNMNSDKPKTTQYLNISSPSAQTGKKPQAKGKGKLPVVSSAVEPAQVIRREEEASARLAKESAAAAQRERQLQLAREREEAKEREKAAQRRKQEEDWAKEAAVTIQKVVLSSFVKFEAGLTIQHVICGFEASQILIKNLPLNARRSEIIDLFTQQGVDREDLAILRTENVDGHRQATVLGKGADVDVIALGLDGIEFRDKNLEFVVCERTSAGRTMGSSNRNSYHLSISWRPPFLAMIVRYPNLETWEIPEKARNLNGLLLNGQRVKAEYHQEQAGYGFFDDDYDYTPPTFTVKISKIPAGTTVADVRTFSGTPAVELYHDTSSYTSDEVFNALNTHLRSLPNSTLQTFALENSPRPNSVSAKAVFGSWESAKSAHDSLTGRTLRFGFPPLRLFLSDPYRFVLTVDENQYNAQKAQWTELCGRKDKEATLQTRTVDRVGGRKVIITLYGRDKKAVGALKVRIESMATGQKLDAIYWHPTFKNAKGQEFFDDLYHSTGAYIRSDWKHNCLAVFGRAEAVEVAKTRIKEEVERISAEQWTIPLQRRALGFFIREGLAKMRGLLGEENVTLDVGAAKIVLRGADLEEARHHLRQLMDTFMDRSMTSTKASDDTLCPICYDTVSQPIEIGCLHIYCSSCLRHYILSTLDNHTFPLKCMGNDATCNVALSLPLIRKFLPPQRFEQLMEAAFSSYIDKNPETFKYCNTPDCSQVYRAANLPHELQCPSCFSEVCTACFNEGHAGMTCAEGRIHKDPGEQERLLEAWATENRVKRCPSCRAWVEKTEGCNHMTCQCGTHFCWICLGVFDQGQIYDHMAQAHGGIYNEPEARVNPGWPAVVQPQQNLVPDIVDIVGGPAAAAEQIAAFRRIEAERANRVQPAAPVRNVGFVQLPHAIPPPAPERVLPGVRNLVRNPLVEEAERRRREALRDWQQYRQQAEEADRQRVQREAERRRALMALRNQEAREQALQRQVREREEAARRREAEENKGWCTIM